MLCIDLELLSVRQIVGGVGWNPKHPARYPGESKCCCYTRVLQPLSSSMSFGRVCLRLLAHKRCRALDSPLPPEPQEHHGQGRMRMSQPLLCLDQYSAA